MGRLRQWILKFYILQFYKFYNCKILRFVKQIFISAMMFFSCNLSNVNSLKCVSIKNRECKIRSAIVNINSGEPTFYP